MCNVSKEQQSFQIQWSNLQTKYLVKRMQIPKDITKILERQEGGRYLLFIYLAKVTYLEHINICKSVTKKINSSIEKWTRLKPTLDNIITVINIGNVQAIDSHQRMQVKTAITTYPPGWLTLKKTTTHIQVRSSVDKDVEQPELSDTSEE